MKNEKRRMKNYFSIIKYQLSINPEPNTQFFILHFSFFTFHSSFPSRYFAIFFYKKKNLVDKLKI